MLKLIAVSCLPQYHLKVCIIFFKEYLLLVAISLILIISFLYTTFKIRAIYIFMDLDIQQLTRAKKRPLSQFQYLGTFLPK